MGINLATVDDIKAALAAMPPYATQDQVAAAIAAAVSAALAAWPCVKTMETPKGWYSKPLGAMQSYGAPGIFDPTSGQAVCPIPPPYSGVGPFRFYTDLDMFLENQGATAAKVCYGIGVSRPDDPNKPMYPYLGVNHSRDEDRLNWITIPPGGGVAVHNKRVDTVDNTLESDQPIPNWPAWVVTGSPLLVPCAGIDSSTPGAIVVARAIQMVGFRIG